MHGGVKVYRGSPAAARTYVEADRSRADDYYLAEGTGLAERYVATPTAGVTAGVTQGVSRSGTLDGDAYEAWVAGLDPVTGVAKGRLRSDDRGVRFVEVVVNGPKSWSLAAALHPDIAAAYDAAQDRAAVQVIGWLAEHATTRVGPRGRQVQVPVQQIEAVTVRHYTSRAGDPHRHLHLQINARVFAEGGWRGLHTVGVRDSLDALNGIGHAAVTCDPGFRTALAGHGFTVDPASGEVVELARFVGPFSARAAQIARHVDRYEADWRTTHPGAEPDRRLRRSWDARAWAEQRPDKIVPTDGTALTQRWVEELHELGYHDPDPVDRSGTSVERAGESRPVRVGDLDRNRAAGVVVTRLGARRSGWNAADVRGQVERLIASTGIVVDPGIRVELAEDLTERALGLCVPLLGRRGIPEHIRILTSQQVLEVEADLTTRLIARTGTVSPTGLESIAVAGLDAGQAQVVAALVGEQQLVVVEGAAGAGKTTTLAAASAGLAHRGRRLVVVTPTLQAATVAAEQVGAPAFSAAWLAHQHGYRWDTDGLWTRLRPGEVDPATGGTYRGPQPHAVLSAGDLLLVDEAGMLDQDTARALMVIADEHAARVALVGDRHQLPAVGRGGVLDLATRWAAPEARLMLGAVHRFADPAYAQLSLAMRTGQDPGAIFDTLVARGEIRVYTSEAERTAALAQLAATAFTTSSRGDRERTLVVADTREQVAGLNAAIRDRLVAVGQVDDTVALTTRAGQRVGVGDLITTRRNDREADVANRDSWTVTGHLPDGGLSVTGRRGDRMLSGSYVREDVELGYASTVYGAQGATTATSHLVVGEHTGAAAAYVAMTRGRDANTAHLVAESLDATRGQWVEVFSRDRADLGPAHAARRATEQADRYQPHRSLERALDDLHQAWTAQADLTEEVAIAGEIRDRLVQVVALRNAGFSEVDRLWQVADRHWQIAEDARARVGRSEAAIAADATRIGAAVRERWEAGVPAARQAVDTVRQGVGRFGRHRGEVCEARDHLEQWAQTWRPVLPDLPTDADQLRLTLLLGGSQLHQAISRYAHDTAEAAHPNHARLRLAAHDAAAQERAARQDHRAASASLTSGLDRLGSDLAYTPDPVGRLAETGRAITDLTDHLAQAHDRVGALRREPAIRTLPPDRLRTEREIWAADRTQASEAAQHDAARRATLAETRTAQARRGADRYLTPDHPRRPAPGQGPGIGR